MIGPAPAPRRGGTLLLCPMVNVPATEDSGTLTMCPWHAQDTAKGRKQYRRHWRQGHFEPFLAETPAVMEALTSGKWAGVPVTARIKVSKG